jgi:hypothetical protein
MSPAPPARSWLSWTSRSGTAAGSSRKGAGSPLLIGLPQPEPAFSILPVNPAGFRDIYLAHRNVMLVNPGNDYSDTVVDYSRNRWAETQLVITVTGPDWPAVDECIRKNGEAIRQSINDAERDRLTSWLTSRQGRRGACSFRATGDGSWLMPAGYKPDFNRERS